ncbi:minor tail protein [Mycobacterium phage Raela]|uniref:Minor tail protein n=1 Tax=Mycobacterium phage Raela TaxID=2499054 RepID=A0A3S9U9C2_9CAUD|nr:minor tail protein [Mycobacterium phage Raela]
MSGWWAEAFIKLEGIASAEAFGAPSVATGAVNISGVGGIPSAEAFGTPTFIWEQDVELSGIPSAEAFGTMKLNQNVTLTGIESAEEFGGIAEINQTLMLSGIPSAEAFGTTVVRAGQQPEIVGFNINPGTTVTIPAHQVGDVIVIMAYNDGATNPGLPSAGGTVPTWNNVHNGNGNTNAARVAWAVATATNHTSGTWSNSTAVAAVVLRDAEELDPIGARSLNFGSTSNQSVANALTTDLWNNEGLSQLLYGHGHKTVTAWSAAPSGFTRLGQVNTELAVNVKDDSTTDGAATQAATTSSSAGYMGTIVEVKRRPLTGYVWPRRVVTHGNSSSSSSEAFTCGANDRVLVVSASDRVANFTCNVDGDVLSMGKVAQIQYDAAWGNGTLDIWLSKKLTAGAHTLNRNSGAWSYFGMQIVANVESVRGLAKTTKTAGGSTTASMNVGAPPSGGRTVQAFGVGSNASLASPLGGRNRILANSNASISVSDTDEATTFSVSKSSSPEWAGLAVELSPEAPSGLRPNPIRHPRIVANGLGSSTISTTVDLVAGETYIFDFVADRGVSTPLTFKINGNTIPLEAWVNFNGSATDAGLERWIFTAPATDTYSITAETITGGPWWYLQMGCLQGVTSVVASATAAGTGTSTAPSHSVNPNAGELVYHVFAGPQTSLYRETGGTQWHHESSNGATFATSLADAAATFACPSNQGWGSIYTRFA